MDQHLPINNKTSNLINTVTFVITKTIFKIDHNHKPCYDYGPNDGFANIDNLEDILFECFKDTIATTLKSMYHLFGNSIDNPTYLENVAMLTPIIDIVHSINKYMNPLNV